MKKALTTPEAAKHCNMALSYFYKKNAAGLIPGGHKPLGKKLFWDADILDSWLLGSTVNTPREKREIEASTYLAQNSK